jgi:hypothetical protein
MSIYAICDYIRDLEHLALPRIHVLDMYIPRYAPFGIRLDLDVFLQRVDGPDFYRVVINDDLDVCRISFEDRLNEMLEDVVIYQVLVFKELSLAYLVLIDDDIRDSMVVNARQFIQNLLFLRETQLGRFDLLDTGMCTEMFDDVLDPTLFSGSDKSDDEVSFAVLTKVA